MKTDSGIAARMQAAMRKLVFFHMKALSVPELETELSRSQVSTLLEIGNSEPTTMGDLAETLGIAPGSLTGIVDKLIEKEFVTRDRSAVDRRKVIVTLTDSGKTMHLSYRERQSRLSDMFFGLLDAGESETLVNLIEKLIAGIENGRGSSAMKPDSRAKPGQ